MNRLGARLAERIRLYGPIGVAEFMALALADPDDGYYTTREAIGAAGDFITAPEVSQMFGELIGAWCHAAWLALGRPSPVRLVELGPGRGTLMADMLRTAAGDPDFRRAIDLHLVEVSPRMRALQAERLAGSGAQWHDRFADVPAGPLLVVANEFFDALPVHQFVLTRDGWRERVVGIDDAGNLAFGAGPGHPAVDLLPGDAGTARPGAIFEVNLAAEAMMADLSGRIAATGGALLAIDYGTAASRCGDSFQAMTRHGPAPVLERPGEVDLTAHVDFAALAKIASTTGACVLGPTTQGHFLLELGLLDRAGRLGAAADAAGRAEIQAAVERLAGEAAMGRLFKVLAVTSGFTLPGFATPALTGSQGSHTMSGNGDQA